MKKFILYLVVAILTSNSIVFSQNLCNPPDSTIFQNLFDSHFILGNSAIVKLDHFHNWQNWTSFVQVSPTNKYALLEFGPKFNLPGGSLKLRAGLNISTAENGAKYVDQQALTLFYKWKKITFLSVNEIKDITRNKPFHWSADQYYFEHDLKYDQFGVHIETVWWGKNFKTFTGPSYSFSVGAGNLVIWPGWEIGTDRKILAFEYNVPFK